VKVLVVGLDNSGKTSILQWLKSQKTQNEVAPTVGYNMDTFERNNLNFSFIDMSGQN
jgi:ADP-ribosylation factor-like protein 6